MELLDADVRRPQRIYHLDRVGAREFPERVGGDAELEAQRFVIDLGGQAAGCGGEAGDPGCRAEKSAAGCVEFHIHSYLKLINIGLDHASLSSSCCTRT